MNGELIVYLNRIYSSLVSWASDFAPILGTVFTTVVAIVVGRFVWTWRNKPALKIVEGISTQTGYKYDNNEWDNAPLHFRVHLVNLGLSSAENCKTELQLRGESDTKQYKLTTPVCWSEGNYPARSTVNRGETIAFDIFRQGTKDGEDYLRFPSENGWPEYSRISEEPTLQVRESAEGASTSVERNRTPVSDLEVVEWDRARVVVTSENADLVKADLSFSWNLEEGDREALAVEAKQTNKPWLLRWRMASSKLKELVGSLRRFIFKF